MKKIAFIICLNILYFTCMSQAFDANTGIYFGRSHYENAPGANQTTENYTAVGLNVIDAHLSILGLVLNDKKFAIGEYWGLGFKLGGAFYNSGYDIEGAERPNLIGGDHLITDILFDYGFHTKFRFNPQTYIGANFYFHWVRNSMRFSFPGLGGSNSNECPMVIGIFGKTKDYMARFDISLKKKDDNYDRSYMKLQLKKALQGHSGMRYLGVKISYIKSTRKIIESQTANYMDLEFVYGIDL